MGNDAPAEGTDVVFLGADEVRSRNRLTWFSQNTAIKIQLHPMVRNCSFKLFGFPIVTRKNVEAAISSLGAALLNGVPGSTSLHKEEIRRGPKVYQRGRKWPIQSGTR